MKKLPIGIDDFKKIIEGNYYYADNSTFIQQLDDSGAEVTLITRPRRFGKTLTLSMVHHFYNVKENNQHLFTGLNIQQETVFAKANQHPVLFFSMKELKDSTWQVTYEKISILMQRLYAENEEVMKTFLAG